LISICRRAFRFFRKSNTQGLFEHKSKYLIAFRVSCVFFPVATGRQLHMKGAFFICMVLVFLYAGVNGFEECRISRPGWDEYNSSDCHGATCRTVVRGYHECYLCPLGRTGFRCEHPPAFASSSECNLPCQSSRCMQSLDGPVCADRYENTVATFLPSRSLPSGAVYGPYVCGITAPCTF
jgi:hypothetical protein